MLSDHLHNLKTQSLSLREFEHLSRMLVLGERFSHAAEAKAIIPKKIAPRLTSARQLSTPTIPRVIHQTFETSQVTQSMYDAAMRWVEINPEFEYRFYDKDDRRDFIRKHFGGDMLSAYDKINHGAFKADFWRYCILYQHGGVYADIDILTLAPLRQVIHAGDQFVAAREPIVRYGITNSFICVPSKHPFMKAAIERATQKIHENSGKFDGFMLTGPANLGMAVNACLGRAENTEQNLGVSFDGTAHSYRLVELLSPLPNRPRCMVDNGRVILQSEYPGYRKELSVFGLKHWLMDPVYSGFVPRLRRSLVGRVVRRYVRKFIPKTP
ncbi:Glycosyltransferase sugar-binding region containing DXD motif protein [Roseovarius albus]|uniref:Glycosyltransferase sugar-binding region containing DXD motif protein n=1 Tax=Roseovarius albus TaxID=1247867 RepID=A0A1X6ZYD2_9RHOB|nr:glycosyltransferase [Roseovarius albus]SLN63460.1 Glycosyltransferase sugar-binding region containing DXD motif protein [Roseovarius albus]